MNEEHNIILELSCELLPVYIGTLVCTIIISKLSSGEERGHGPLFPPPQSFPEYSISCVYQVTALTRDS